MGLTLANSQQDLIKERAAKIEEEFEISQRHNFHNKYKFVLTEDGKDKKLGEGQHAMVYECYLIEDEEEKKDEEETKGVVADLPKKTSKLPTVQAVDIDSNESDIDDNDHIFDRAKSVEDTRKRFAVKISRNDDHEVLLAHEKEF